jgi:hypothetical protein
MIKYDSYNRKVPALLQSKTTVSDEMSMSIKREFIEGYVLKVKWGTYGDNSPILVSTKEVENGDGEFIKVRVYPYESN